MPDPESRDHSGAIIDATKGAALERATAADAVKPMTHDVDMDDMMNPVSEYRARAFNDLSQQQECPA